MRRLLTLVLPLAIAAIACDDEHLDPIGAGPGQGDGFDVLLVDDPTLDPTTPPPGGEVSVIDGTIEGSARVALRNQNGALTNLGAFEDFVLPLQDANAAVSLPATRPPTGTYTGLQLTLQNLSVLVEQGSRVGGVVLDQDVTLDVGPTGITVAERSLVPIPVEAGTELDLTIDLNAETWITLDNIEDEIVDDAEVGTGIVVVAP